MDLSRSSVSEIMSGLELENLRRENQILRSIKANLENEVMLSLNKEKFLQNNLEMITNDRNEYKVLECFTGLLN